MTALGETFVNDLDALSLPDRERLRGLGLFRDDQSHPSFAVFTGSDAEGQLLRSLRAAANAETLFTVLVRCGVGAVPAGPVVIASAAGTTAPFEVWVGAGVAASGARRVVHLNSNGPVSATLNGSRSQVRDLVRGWHDIRSESVLQGIRAIDSSPAVIVVQTETEEIVGLSHEYPGADLVCVVPGIGVTAELASTVVSVFESACAMRLVQLRSQNVSDAGEREGAGVTSDENPEVACDPASAGTGTGTGVRASDVVFVRLTDREIEFVNRTGFVVKLDVFLGSTETVHRTGKASKNPVGLSVRLLPGAQQTIETADIDALRALRPPSAVQRSWSHSASTVYEGGEQAIHGIEVSLFELKNNPLGGGAFSVPNGLDLAITARDLMGMLNRVPASVLPEPKQRADQSQVTATVLLSAMLSAFATADSLLHS